MDTVQTVETVVAIFAALVGWPAFLAAGINLLKYFKVIPDGIAPQVVFWANLVAFVGVGVAVFTGELEILAAVDAALIGLAKVLAEVVILLGGGLSAMGMTKVFHLGLRGLPGIGYQHPKG